MSWIMTQLNFTKESGYKIIKLTEREREKKKETERWRGQRQLSKIDFSLLKVLFLTVPTFLFPPAQGEFKAEKEAHRVTSDS